MSSTSQPPITPTPVPYDYQTLADLKDTGIRALLYAPPKAGKTGLALTFPTPDVADYDGEGVKVAKSPWFRKNFPEQCVDGVIRFKTFEDKLDDYAMPTNVPPEETAFFRGIKWINAVLRVPDRQTIVVDGITSMSKAALYASLPVLKKRGERSKTWGYKDVDHMLLLAKQDFGGEMGAIEQLLDQLMKIKGKNIIVCAHERQETTDSGAVVGRTPLVTGDRLRAKIAGWFDDVWYLDTNASGQRILRCQPYGVLKGVGSRLGLPATIEDPSYAKIVKLLNAGG